MTDLEKKKIQHYSFTSGLYLIQMRLGFPVDKWEGYKEINKN